MQHIAAWEQGPVARDDGVRVTATITRQQDRMLRALADRHKVSVAWLVRHAIDRLLGEGEAVQLPLDLKPGR
jgi:hypothetical protein